MTPDTIPTDSAQKSAFSFDLINFFVNLIFRKEYEPHKIRKILSTNFTISAGNLMTNSKLTGIPNNAQMTNAN